MTPSLPFFNWSLKRALEALPDSFSKAKVRVLYTVLLFAFAKALVVIWVAAANEQWRQVSRAVLILTAYLIIFKLLLARPHLIRAIAHVMVIAGVLLVWSTFLLFSNGMNIAAAQFIFMIILCSFYTLGSRIGLIYSSLAITPVLISLFTNGSVSTFFFNSNQVLLSPAREVVITLNFATIIVAHYLYYRAFTLTIEERTTLNEQLQHSIIEANKLAESKTNFLSTMSHELRTPLNSVIGMAELMIRDNKDPDQDENLRILQSSSQDLLALINNILDLNKADSDKLQLETVPFHLEELIRSRCAGLLVRARDKGLAFRIIIPEGLKNLIVVSDPTRLSQIIYNLVANAIKFTPSGSVNIRLESTGRSAGHESVLFKISDTGIGISEDKHQSIFELFTQGEAYTTRNYGGTGLGLAIVKKLLQLFGSTIHLVSTPGKGSTFSFEIKFKTAHEQITGQATDKDQAAGIGNLRILIAEDNPVNRLILSRQLEKLDATSVIVEDGAQALEAYLSSDYDVILLDLHMPVLDGYEAIARIRSLNDPVKASVPVLAFTASITEQDRILEAGFDNVLHKPASISDLQEKLLEVAGKLSQHVH